MERDAFGDQRDPMETTLQPQCELMIVSVSQGKFLVATRSQPWCKRGFTTYAPNGSQTQHAVGPEVGGCMCYCK